MEFRILGRLEVVDDGRDITPPRLKQQGLLALLLLRAGERVSPEEAAEALWEGRPPPAARNAVQGHVAALRKLLGRGRIETRNGGYVLHLDEDELDLHRFERVLTGSRGRPLEEQSELLAEALALFRGAPLEDLRYESFASAEANRIEELRLLALESKVDADLSLGRHELVVPELERLVREAPLRERLWTHLMLALYRCGRQADAVTCYRRAKAALDELGLEPGIALQRLERQILNQDPELELVSVRTSRARIPTPPTPLLGRERELAEVRGLVLSDDVRLVTLTGPGGAGKTRLALEAARGAAAHFPGGTFFVSLASVADPDLVLPAVSHALGINEGGGSPLVDSLAAGLGDRPALAVLDNVEHLLGAAPALGGLLAASPNLMLLVTSREPLRLYGEHLYRVPPLDAAAAAALFLDRAQAVRANLPRSESTHAAIAEICVRLDGLPLAIELAAARVELFAPEELLVRLRSSLDLLTEGPVDHPERQQTLRRTLDWSYERLTADEQRLFARLATFSGGWTLDAADAVCGEDMDIVGGLSSLLDKSLLHVDPSGDESRQAMLETIREYAGQRLEEAAEAEDLRRRHLEHFLALAEEAEPQLRGSPAKWIDRLEADHGNLRAALDRIDVRRESELEQRLAGALWRFWYLQSHLLEGRRRLERALADGKPTARRAKVLLGSAVMALNTADAAVARLRAEEGLALYRDLGDAWGEAYCSFLLGHLAGDDPQRRKLYEGAILTFRELGDEHSALLASRHLALTRDDPEEARALHEENLARARASGNKRIAATALGALAEHAMAEKRVEEALSLLREGLAIHSEAGDVLDTAVDLCRFAAALASAGQPATAATLLASFDAMSETVGGRRALMASLNEQTLALIHAQLDDAAFAEAQARGVALTLDEAVAVALLR